MSLVKIRRDGNSLAITIPVNEAREAHLEEGMYVKVETNEGSHSLSIQQFLEVTHTPSQESAVRNKHRTVNNALALGVKVQNLA